MTILGMMSGTSLDGIDAALCEINGSGANLRAELRAFECVPYSPELRARLLRACANEADVREVARLNVAVGEAFAGVANLVFEKHGRADLIGSHGQTIAHLPAEGVTFQIGEGAVLAERCGVPVVCDFRPRDLAAGGQGAPLVPYVDWVLLRSSTNRVICNIGGIANVSILPANCELESVRAWDCGPGNMLIDEAARRYLGLNCDPNGKFADGGEEDKRLVVQALKHPFFAKSPPKTAGREEFGAEFLDQFLEIAATFDREIETENITRNAHNLLADLTRLTARSIAQSVRQFAGFGDDFEIIVGGGGVFNATLMRFLKEEIAPANVLTHEDLGLRSDAKEALAFAILAHESWQGVSTNVAGATGARGARVLGKIVPF